MPTVKFFTRTNAKQGNLIPIYCRFRGGRKVDMTSKSKILVQPNHFNNKTGSMRHVADATDKDKTNKDLRELKNYIFLEFSKITDIETMQGNWLSTIIDKFWNPEKYKPKVLDLFSFIQDFIDKAPTRINSKSGRPVCYKMIREYERTFYYLKEYAKNYDTTLDFKDIDLKFYYNFIEFLQKNHNLATNTIGKKIQTIKIFLNAATDLGYNEYKYHKSRRFCAISEDTDSIYLNQEELQKIYNHDFSDDPSLERIRDLFIVGCWTGLRFSDISQITSDVIKDGFISIKPKKTDDQWVVIPVHITVEAIIKKYKGVLPRVITNQRFNEYLKDMAKTAKINDDVHIAITRGGVKQSKKYKKWELVVTHTGRRSFATNNYLMGVPTLTIMAITGHKTEKAFLRYIKVTPKEHAERMRTIWQNQVTLKAV